MVRTTRNFTLPNWDSLPDLDLYMDSVITYLEKQLLPFTVEEHENLLHHL